MTLTTALYLTDLLSKIDTCLTTAMILGLLIMGIVFGCWLAIRDEHGCEETDKIFKSILRKWPILLIITISCALIPKKSTMYLMMGATYLEQSELPSKVSQALELKLDDYIKQLKGDDNE